MTAETPVPNFDCLSLDGLESLLSVLGVLADAGRALDMASLNPVFSLTPGRRMTLSIEAVMPRSARLDARQSRITLTGAPVEDQTADGAAFEEPATDPAAELAPEPAPEPPPETPAPEPEPGPVSQSPAGEAAGASSSLSPAADPFAAPPALSEIEAHLLALPRRHGHSLEDDLQLLQLADAGWQPAEIAAELGLDAKAVGQRWDVLSGLDRDTKQRRWTRPALLEALEGWCRPAQGGSA